MPSPDSIPTTTAIAIDLDALADAFDQPRHGPVRVFLDRQTGVIESMPRDAEVEGVFDDIVAAPTRWLEILPLPLDERRRLRARFVEEAVTDDPHLRLRLGEALAQDEGPRLLRFEALLRDRPAVLDAWVVHRAAALGPLIAAWLSALGIAAGPSDPAAARSTARARS